MRTKIQSWLWSLRPSRTVKVVPHTFPDHSDQQLTFSTKFWEQPSWEDNSDVRLQMVIMYASWPAVLRIKIPVSYVCRIENFLFSPPHCCSCFLSDDAFDYERLVAVVKAKHVHREQEKRTIDAEMRDDIFQLNIVAMRTKEKNSSSVERRYTCAEVLCSSLA